MISITTLADIVWRIVRTSPFDSIRPEICHSSVYQLEGKTKPSKSNLSTIIFGKKESAEYFSKLIYVDEPQIKFLGKRTFSDIPLFVEKVTGDLTIVESNWSFSRFLFNNGFLILPQINFALDITDSLEIIQSRMASSKVRRINKIVKAGYTCEITKDPEKLRSFYYDMYLPHMFARHGKSARPVSFSECKKLFLKGDLMLIKQNQEGVAGIILVPHGNELYQPLIAVKNANKQITLGSYAATYYTIIFGKQKGYASVDFGDAPPFLRDGLFQYKKEWGMQIRPAMGYNAQVFGIRFSNLSEAVKDFLSTNPFIFMDGRNLGGLILLNIADRFSTNFSNILGLSSLFVLSSDLNHLNLANSQLKKLTIEDHNAQTNTSLNYLINLCHERDCAVYNLTLKN